MIFVQVCLGSSCHLKNSMQLVNMIKKEIEDGGMKNDIVLIGGFCLGKCNREGVSIKVDDDIFTGVTVEGIKDFYEKNILSRVKAGG